MSKRWVNWIRQQQTAILVTGVLVRTPDHRHIPIDGGWPQRNLPSGKNAADFVDWKSDRDYGDDKIRVDSMICTHNDQAHYGGLWDLLNPQEEEELALTDVRVQAFYHAGLAWWTAPGGKEPGPWEEMPDGNMFTRLMRDRDAMTAASPRVASPRLGGEWRSFMERASEAIRLDGTLTPIQRLSDRTGSLPGFEPTPGQPSVKVLAPVEFQVSGHPAIQRSKSQESTNTNGDRVLLRIDNGHARILLTGDLNRDTHESSLTDYEGHHDEFMPDVVKACHHGSEDASFRFPETMEPTASIISSGENEGHDRPRPSIVAAYSLTGHKQIENDGLITPLVYFTELARSVGLGTPTQVNVHDEEGDVIEARSEVEPKRTYATYKGIKPGDRSLSTRTRPLSARKVAARLVYGLVNVRSDRRAQDPVRHAERKGRNLAFQDLLRPFLTSRRDGGTSTHVPGP